MATILLIDDEPGVRLVLCSALQTLGHTVLEASDGKQGVRLFQDNRVDLVFCDLFLPDQEGLDTIKALRGINSTVKIVAISADWPHPHLVKGMASVLGANRVIEKPFATKAIRKLLTELLPVSPFLANS
jgi:CheY-like chemotaxis protein